MPKIKRQKWLEHLLSLFICGTLLCLAIFANLGQSSGDLFSFWAAAVTYLNGANPYDLIEIRTTLLELPAGGFSAETYPGVSPVYSPPWIFSLIGLFGLLPFIEFSRYWAVFSVIAFFFCYLLTAKALTAWGLQSMADRPKTSASQSLAMGELWREKLLVFFFMPLHLTIVLGQLSPIILFSLTLFLFITSRKRCLSGSFLAGIALSISLIKPHLLFVVYWLVLLESFAGKKIATISGMICGLLCWASLPLLVQPDLYGHYFGKELTPIDWFTPSLGAWLHYLCGIDSKILLFIPLLIVVAIFTRQWLKLNKLPQGRLYSLVVAMAFSSLAAPYQWTYDFVVLLPCLVIVFRLLSTKFASQQKAFYLCMLPSALLWLHAAIGVYSFEIKSMHFAVLGPILVFALAVVAIGYAQDEK